MVKYVSTLISPDGLTDDAVALAKNDRNSGIG
jgi:hypothetical protein